MSAPTATDWIAYARIHNGVCLTCGTINAYDRTRRCDCPTPATSPAHRRGAPTPSASASLPVREPGAPT